LLALTLGTAQVFIQERRRSSSVILTECFDSVKIEIMNIERTELQARAARHAALSDPARLRIVDLLSLGDLAPGELQEELLMPSNLVSHHLAILEREGMISRHRSEADRRRSYVHLLRDGVGQLGPINGAAATRVLFVCSANSARSQLATALWAEQSLIPAVSAGTHPAAAIAPGAVATARRHHIDLPDRQPQALHDVAQEHDFVVTLCDSAHEELGSGALHWSIADPVAIGTDAAFDAAFDEVSRRVTTLARQLSPA
jgi:protein-tyrosine-phosphatase/DNA-binding transcriptional ArsR family regulator